MNMLSRRGFLAASAAAIGAAHLPRIAFAQGVAPISLSAATRTLDIDGRNLYFPAYDTPATNHGVAEGLDGERNQRLFGKLSWGGWTVQAAWVEREKNVPTNPSAYTAFNTPFPTRDESAFLGVRYETDLGL